MIQGGGMSARNAWLPDLASWVITPSPLRKAGFRQIRTLDSRVRGNDENEANC